MPNGSCEQKAERVMVPKWSWWRTRPHSRTICLPQFLLRDSAGGAGSCRQYTSQATKRLRSATASSITPSSPTGLYKYAVRPWSFVAPVHNRNT
jgi:hypothetical protein